MYENINVDLRYFVYKQCTPTWNLNDESINFYDLTFVLSGKAVYTINNHEYVISSGDAVYLPKHSKRVAHTDPNNPMKCVAFNFDYTGCDRLPLKHKFSWKDDDLLKIYFKEINEEWLQQKPDYQLKCKALFMLVLHRVLQHHNDLQLNVKVEKMKKHIIAHMDQKLTIEDIAREMKLSTVYCGALFQKHNKYTISQYLNGIRINKAANLLSSGDFTVSEAAYQCGFDDIYYFSKTFKKLMGIPPSKYKKVYFLSSNEKNL